MVSIITPTWNCGSFIVETISSVQAQTYQNWEMIIADDCSTDDTLSVVQPFLDADSRIKYVRNEKNSGAAITRNNALREAQGRWIAFLDSDDVWMPRKLEHQLTFMVKHGYAFSYHEYEEMDENSRDRGVVISGPRRVSCWGMYCFCWPGCLTVMYDSTVVGLIQVVDIKKNNDYAMWLQVCHKADCYLLPKVLAKYRRGRKGSISTHDYWTLMKWHYYLFRKANRNGVLVSLFLTAVNLPFGLLKKVLYVKRKNS